MMSAMKFGLVTTLGLMSGLAWAQAPAGSTGACKDGTYTSAASKSGACRGHQGVKDWYAATGTATGAAPVAGAPVPSAMTPAAKTAVAPSKPMAAAPVPTTAPAASAPAPTPTSVKATPAGGSARQSPGAAAAARTQAPGGGPGLVWVNTSSKVYHCTGSDFYGKTKSGSYMSESDAKAKGAHGVRGKDCAGK